MKRPNTFYPKARRAKVISPPPLKFFSPTSPFAKASTVRDKYLKTCVTRTTHKRFKVEAERQNKTVSSLLDELVGLYLDEVAAEERWLTLHDSVTLGSKPT